MESSRARNSTGVSSLFEKKLWKWAPKVLWEQKDNLVGKVWRNGLIFSKPFAACVCEMKINRPTLCKDWYSTSSLFLWCCYGHQSGHWSVLKTSTESAQTKVSIQNCVLRKYNTIMYENFFIEKKYQIWVTVFWRQVRDIIQYLNRTIIRSSIFMDWYYRNNCWWYLNVFRITVLSLCVNRQLHQEQK